MAQSIPLAAEVRTRAGKGPARQTRRAGRVPAVIYGNKQAPVMISLAEKDVLKQIRTPGFFSHLFELDLGGSKEQVLARDLQRDPVTDAPLHLDFMRFSATARFDVDVELRFENEGESPGLKFGGVLNVVMRTVPLVCRPDAIPESVTVDLGGLAIGDVIHVRDLKIPADTELAVADLDAPVASVAAPTVAPVEAEETEAAEPVEIAAKPEKKAGGEEG
ncbi:MAG: 50S ribosomal protein L25/general stress protein Ctc [Rhodospirillales bacterium]